SLYFHASSLPLLSNTTLFPYTTLFRSLTQMYRRYWWTLLRQHFLFRVYCFSPLHVHYIPSMAHVYERRHGTHFSVHIHPSDQTRSEEHTSELQSRFDLVCRLLLVKKNT